MRYEPAFTLNRAINDDISFFLYNYVFHLLLMYMQLKETIILILMFLLSICIRTFSYHIIRGPILIPQQYLRFLSKFANILIIKLIISILFILILILLIFFNKITKEEQ